MQESLDDVLADARRDKESAKIAWDNAKAECDRAQEAYQRMSAIEEYLADRALKSPKTAENEDVPQKTVISAHLSPKRFDGKMKFEVAEMILRENGRPMRSGEIAKIIQDAGRENGMEPQVLANALFTAMMRKSKDHAVFRKISRGLWGLATWGEAEEDG